ncbi:MAG: nucleotidyltransferase domain-containing protein [Candidatus Rokubacteria bacterium]|nr:nucleotidyltransferase domain-containing protein [Candidatus Rokubacteria bacterium]
MPAARGARTLPVGEHGITGPTMWARMGDAPSRCDSAAHLQAQAGMVPVTVRGGRQLVVLFRFACAKQLRYAVDQLAWLSLSRSDWARAYYDQQRERGHRHRRALRALGAKWLRRYHRPSGCYTDAVSSSQLIEIPAVDRLVAEFARHPEVVRVWLFGSRARGDHRARSDIDLAVEAPGASRRAWLDLCRLVEEATTLLRIDLVLIEDAPSALAQQIRREGRVLYER